MSVKEYKIENREVSKLIPYANNSRIHGNHQVKQIAASITEFGFTSPLLIDSLNNVIAGHGRLLACELLGIKEVPCVLVSGLTEAQKKALVIADNKIAENSDWDLDKLNIELETLRELDFDFSELGFDFDADFEDFDFSNPDSKEEYLDDGVKGSMIENFLQPPFSVLDTRKADWLERKRWWLSIIKDKGESRENTLSKSKNHNLISELNNGVSILDPVMAEICVSWFGCKGGLAFDPFAGDSIFGYVAGYLGMEFKGIELRKEQAELNQHRVDMADLKCKYYCDTSENMDEYIEDDSIDLVFTCPPYADLEVYSDNTQDLSNMSHSDFFIVYKRILQKTFSKLRNNRFAVVVMGEVRNKKGAYIGTIPKTIQIMEDAGYIYYNEIIIVNGAGTLPLRSGKYMRTSRKVGKMHQNILVFLKGDAKLAVEYLGDVEVAEMEKEYES